MDDGLTYFDYSKAVCFRCGSSADLIDHHFPFYQERNRCFRCNHVEASRRPKKKAKRGTIGKGMRRKLISRKTNRQERT